jgi:hypothetical protein
VVLTDAVGNLLSEWSFEPGDISIRVLFQSSKIMSTESPLTEVVEVTVVRSLPLNYKISLRSSIEESLR